MKLQKDIDRLGGWARKNGYAIPTCQLQHNAADEKLNEIQASYTLEETFLDNFKSIKYLGITTTDDLKWNTHISNVCTKANRTLEFLRRTLISCRRNAKEATNKGIVHPILEYGSSVWDPHYDGLNGELVKMQKTCS